MQSRYQIWGVGEDRDFAGNVYRDIDSRPTNYVVLVRGDTTYAEIHLINDDFVLCLYDQRGEPMIHSEGIGTIANTGEKLLDRARNCVANYAMDCQESGEYIRAANFAASARGMAHSDGEAELAWRLVRLQIEAELEIQGRKRWEFTDLSNFVFPVREHMAIEMLYVRYLGARAAEHDPDQGLSQYQSSARSKYESLLEELAGEDSDDWDQGLAGSYRRYGAVQMPYWEPANLPMPTLKRLVHEAIDRLPPD